MGELTEIKSGSPAVTTPSYTSITEGYQEALRVVDDVILKN